MKSWCYYNSLGPIWNQSLAVADHNGAKSFTLLLFDTISVYDVDPSISPKNNTPAYSNNSPIKLSFVFILQFSTCPRPPSSNTWPGKSLRGFLFRMSCIPLQKYSSFPCPLFFWDSFFCVIDLSAYARFVRVMGTICMNYNCRVGKWFWPTCHRSSRSVCGSKKVRTFFLLIFMSIYYWCDALLCDALWNRRLCDHRIHWGHHQGPGWHFKYIVWRADQVLEEERLVVRTDVASIIIFFSCTFLGPRNGWTR